MKYLTLVRHAKSSWSQPALADHDRPLNDRGNRAAPAMAAFLWQTYLGGQSAEPLLPSPDLLLTSTALRALTTAQIMRERWGLPPERLATESKLYLAPEQRILDIVRTRDENHRHVVVFGHNPGIHDFANRMLARAKVQRYPTCAVAILALPVEFWALADWNEAQLVGFITPRLLEKRFPDTYRNISAAAEE
jgi:phosphohistidine phosphatase